MIIILDNFYRLLVLNSTQHLFAMDIVFARGILRNPRFWALPYALYEDIWTGLGEENPASHPNDTRRYGFRMKCLAYFWQIVELLWPSSFFPRQHSFPFDRWDDDRNWPSAEEFQAVMLDDTVDIDTTNEEYVEQRQNMLASDYNVHGRTDHFRWEQAIREGIDPWKKYITAFSEPSKSIGSKRLELASQDLERDRQTGLRIHDEPHARVTVWEESHDEGPWNEHTWEPYKPMNAGIFIVAGTMASELSLGAGPHFVSLIRIAWREQIFQVKLKTEAATLRSQWLLMDGFIIPGIADAGLAETILSLRHTQDMRYLFKNCSDDSSNDSSVPPGRLVFTFPEGPVSSTWNPDLQGHFEDCGTWKSRREVLPCINESRFWSGQAEQWRRRALYAARDRAKDPTRSRACRVPPFWKITDSSFEGMGVFLAYVDTRDFAKVSPKPILYVAPLKLEQKDIPRWWHFDFGLGEEPPQVQKSILEKWEQRIRPKNLPHLLCDTQDDFKLLAAQSGSDYLAISHRWGQLDDAALQDEIQIVARAIGVRYAWVDIWCMPEDPHERALEIAKMGDYYSQASAVAVLLPEVNLTTSYTSIGNGEPFDLRLARRCDAGLGHQILASAWRSRVWTIPEGLLGQNCIVKTCQQLLDGEYLDHILHVPKHCQNAQWAALGHVFPAAAPLVNVRGEWSTKGLRDYSSTFGSRLCWGGGRAVDGVSRMRLVEALPLGELRECTQPLDAVIGLLGLVEGRIPPLAAQADTWLSLWTKLAQNGVLGVDALRSESVCEEEGMCWAPAPIDNAHPLSLVGILEETSVREFKLGDEGVEISGIPLEVAVGEPFQTEDSGYLKKIRGQRAVTITVLGSEPFASLAQVLAKTGDNFDGVALMPKKGDKGVLVLLGKWIRRSHPTLLIHRQSSLNTVKTMKLLEALKSYQEKRVIVGTSLENRVILI